MKKFSSCGFLCDIIDTSSTSKLTVHAYQYTELNIILLWFKYNKQSQIKKKHHQMKQENYILSNLEMCLWLL